MSISYGKTTKQLWLFGRYVLERDYKYKLRSVKYSTSLHVPNVSRWLQTETVLYYESLHDAAHAHARKRAYIAVNCKVLESMRPEAVDRTSLQNAAACRPAACT